MFSPYCYSLQQLGWGPFFFQQLIIDELEHSYPARVIAVHRNGPVVLSEHGESSVLQSRVEAAIAVGDWLLVERDSPRAVRLLERRSLIARLAAGLETKLQPIAANLDTVFIVTSCGEDFSLSRLERYLAVAHEAQVEPVIVLTKADLCDNVEALLTDIARIAPAVDAIAINATESACGVNLQPWLGGGRTVAVVGSSGVGKSTLINSLLGRAVQRTGPVRAGDQTGRHTTTSREMIQLSRGAWLIDTPGMRELKVGAVDEGVRATFADVEMLARTCRFRDCKHHGNKGCAITAAIAAGSLDQRRFDNYLKLQREVLHATRSVHERHEAQRKFGRIYKAVKEEMRRKKTR